MTRSVTSLQIRSPRGARAAALVVLYVIGLSGALLHIATVEHHDHLPGHGHPDCATGNSAAVVASSGCQSCCHTLHDALSNQFHSSTVQSLKVTSSRTPATTVSVSTCPASQKALRPDHELPPPVRTAVAKVTAGRAPPISLPV